MKQIQKQHHLAVGLLEVLGLTQVRLERQKDGSFTFVAWNTPLVDGNGTPKRTRPGEIRVK
jgi:hypothetical protein